MTHQDSYKKCLKTMYGLRRFGIKLGLSTIRNILNGLGNPQDSFQSIHIAGTNGKGSIASALATILDKAGFRVGLYTSPHLVRFNERIQINGQYIADKDVVTSYKAVKKAHFGDREPTFFEFSTAMAFYEFGRQNVDWAVIETGMGGRLDATNIIKPALSIISNISLEHQEYLGTTISQITFEKAGIIKEKIPAITGVKQENAFNVIKKIAQKNFAPLYCMGRDFRVKRDQKGTFSYFGVNNIWKELSVGLQGDYQVENAALVIAACEILGKNIEIPFSSIKQGLDINRWPGRLEIVSESPLVLLDGAHNLIAARNLARFLSKNLSNRKITLIAGILDDKPYKAMLKSLAPFCKKAIFTKPKIGRALEPKKLEKAVSGLFEKTMIIPRVDKAVDYAVKTASKEDAVCIAGSLYLVGEAKEEIGKILPKTI